MYSHSSPCEKLAKRAPFRGGEGAGVVLEGEGRAIMVLQVPPHFSLGGGSLQRPSNPDPVYSKTKNKGQKTLLQHQFSPLCFEKQSGHVNSGHDHTR